MILALSVQRRVFWSGSFRGASVWHNYSATCCDGSFFAFQRFHATSGRQEMGTAIEFEAHNRGVFLSWPWKLQACLTTWNFTECYFHTDMSSHNIYVLPWSNISFLLSIQYSSRFGNPRTRSMMHYRLWPNPLRPCNAMTANLEGCFLVLLRTAPSERAYILLRRIKERLDRISAMYGGQTIDFMTRFGSHSRCFKAKPIDHHPMYAKNYDCMSSPLLFPLILLTLL